jgi:hypothetical protein
MAKAGFRSQATLPAYQLNSSPASGFRPVPANSGSDSRIFLPSAYENFLHFSASGLNHILVRVPKTDLILR